MNERIMIFDNRYICSFFIYYFAVTMICPNHLGRKSIFAFSVTPDPHVICMQLCTVLSSYLLSIFSLYFRLPSSVLFSMMLVTGVTSTDVFFLIFSFFATCFMSFCFVHVPHGHHTSSQLFRLPLSSASRASFYLKSLLTVPPLHFVLCRLES